jgi:hypothetical protein
MTAWVSMKPVSACLGLVALAWSTGACDWGIPGPFTVGGERPPADAAGAAVDASAPVDADATAVHAVRGTAVGVLAALDLRLEHPDGSEIVRVDGDGSFAFEARLAGGAAYAVALVDDTPCVIANGSGVVDAADVEVELACEAVLLTALSVSGPAAPGLPFDQVRRDYTADVSLLQQGVRVTATAAHPDATIEIGGVLTPSGEPSALLQLALGENPIEVVVRHPSGAARTYRVDVRRDAAIAEYAYRRASHPGAGEQLGYSVAVWNDTLAVGAYQEGSAARGVLEADDDGGDAADDSGAVYVFRRTGSGWVQDAYIKASNAAAYAEFGVSVALWGDTLAVGARGESSDARGIIQGTQPSTDNGGSRESGAVYVYRRGEDGAWSQEAYIKASNNGVRDEFGERVALWDDTLAVGAPQEDSSATGVNGPQEDEQAAESGAVYVYRRQQETWGQEAYLKPSSTHAGDKFGVSVALGPDVLAVGAFLEDGGSTGVGGDPDDAGAPDSGAAYVYRRVGFDWAQEAYLKASNTGAGDELGHGLALDGDTLVVGAPRENGSAAGDDEAACNSGAAYVFRHQDGAWMQVAYLKAPGAGAGDAFGRGLALAGDTLVVGAYDDDRASEDETCSPASGGVDDEGGVLHVFQRAGGVWAHAARIEADGGAAGDQLSWSVALQDGALVAGAPRRDDGADDGGAVYVFH